MEQNNLPANVPPDLPPVPQQRFAFSDPDLYQDDPERGGPGLKRYLAAVVYYKWIVIATLVLGTGAGVYLSRSAPLGYVAEARLWISVPTRETEMQGPIRASELLEGNSWVQLFGSFSVLDSVVQSQRLRIVVDPQYAHVLARLNVAPEAEAASYRLTVDRTGSAVTLRSTDGALMEQVAVGAPLGGAAGFSWTPDPAVLRPDLDVSFSVLSPRTAARNLMSNLDPQLAPGGTFLSLRYTAAHRQRTAEVLNAVVDRYVAVAADLKSAKLHDLRDILESQLNYSAANLDNAELALESFNVATITLPSDAGTPVTPGLEETQASVLSNYFDLKVRRDQLEQDRNAIVRLLDGAGGSGRVSVDALSFVPAVQQSPELTQALRELTDKRAGLRALEQGYTAEHPLVRSAAADIAGLENVVVPRLAAALIAELDIRAETMDDLVNSASSELREIPPRAIDQARLRRAAVTAENLYNDLRQRFEGARLAAATSAPDVRILEYATVPERPASDPRTLIILLGALAGLGIGVVTAILLERLDPRIRYAEQVSGGMRLNILGAFPDLAAGRRRLFGGGTNAEEMVEALRGVRLNIMSAYGAAGPVMLTVSSPGPGDGKTFTTSRLAAAFADVGKRTLIIDGDTRRGSLHRLFECDRLPGLTDYLAGTDGIGGIIRQTANPGMDLIPCGSRSTAAPDLLSSPRMGELLAAIRPLYEVILIDSPPLGAGVDPLILASLSGNLMLVMRPGTTHRALAEAKIAMLDRLPVRVLGAIINGVGTEDSYRYYSYIPGYEAAEEEAEDRERLQPALINSGKA
ncbi:MAG: polysaccharide biosynthesis tyrosine autokinase [Gemmatimonadota bacterium]